ncbi:MULTISPECIES: nuclear transport factor 2 family protein [Streptosporangium]|uniref:Ketosteroid isomerase-like protein n=1 Tax=Streptosporangium brasiliense TaxID=47480 RepID=A0ABT9QWJ3_9ACTN|nr:nuclear transport factor 2 family protein [Streptosporangium brasiliense]MDP9861345.1 ketosteroid isomerase-like protein [Streptosporangium brasiliense]
MTETQGSPFDGGAFTPTAEDRQSVEAWFAEYDAHSAKVDVERMADMAMFPLNVVTDSADGEGLAAQWTRERFMRTMSEVMGGGEQGEIQMESTRTPHFLTKNLVVVVTDATMTMNGEAYGMRYADLLVKAGGRWVFQTMVQGGWAEAWNEAPQSA